MNRLFEHTLRLAYYVTQPLSAIILHNSRRVRVLILSEDSVLLQRTSFGRQRWSLPGGGVNRGETALQAALRETKEEAGVQLKESQLVCLGERRMAIGYGKHFPKAAVVFYKAELSIRSEPHITRSLEILEAQWFKLNTLPKNHGPTLDAALEMIKK